MYAETWYCQDNISRIYTPLSTNTDLHKTCCCYCVPVIQSQFFISSIQVEARTLGWVALALSHTKSIQNADVVIGWVDEGGKKVDLGIT